MADGSTSFAPGPLAAFSSTPIGEIMDTVEAYNRAPISRTISPADGGMADPAPNDLLHYWRDGASAMETIFQALLGAKCTPPRRILDFPCGYGRLARHLVAAFSNSELTACDIDPHAVHFCATHFGAVPASSSNDLESVTFPQPFDMIWCGSLFSHLPESKFRSGLGLISRSLAPGGLALLTLHGRYSSVYGRGAYLPDDRFDTLRQAYEAEGFAYADYSDEPGPATGNYGITLSSPAFVMKALEPDTSLRLLSYTERGWNDHQDILVLRKSPLLDSDHG